MRTTYVERVGPRIAPGRALEIDLDRLRRMTALTAIVALAAALRFFNLSSLGYANSYYAAAVESMLQSWHNFFFVAAEPGGSVSVDKPPVGFWLQAISAHFLGVNSLGLILPQIVAGLLSVIVVYHLVRRSFGTPAALIAALALAITPVVVATDRNNTIDSTLILTLLLAAWAFIKATEMGRLKYLLLGALLVGIGFNIKMLEAYLPLPAFYALYFLGSRQGIWRKVGNLSLASLLLVAVSLSWATIVDLTPANQRPYVGSSGDNSELSLAIGYNGVERLLGMGGRGSLLSSLFGDGYSANSSSSPQFVSTGAGGAFPRPPAGARNSSGATESAPFGSSSQFGPRPQNGPGGGGGIFNTGQPGPLRLFTGSLGKDIGWLLPFGLFGAVLLAFRGRTHWSIDPKHQALVLWGGWLVTEAIFFSVAGFFHEYYLSMLGAPLAALVGIGAMELWGMRGSRPWIAAALLVVATGGTIAVQASIAGTFVSSLWWLPPAIAVLLTGAVLLGTAAYRNWHRVALAGFSCVVAALLVTPGIWSVLTSMDPSTSQMLPAAYSGQSLRGFGGMMSFGQADRGQSTDSALLTYLESHTQGTKYLVAVASSQQGANLVLATGRPVLYIGGFSGQDKVVTSSDLTKMVADGELRYILWGGNGSGPGGGQSDISTWVAQRGTPVQGLDTQASGGQFGGFGSVQGTLYELSVASVSG